MGKGDFPGVGRNHPPFCLGSSLSNRGQEFCRGEKHRRVLRWRKGLRRLFLRTLITRRLTKRFPDLSPRAEMDGEEGEEALGPEKEAVGVEPSPSCMKILPRGEGGRWGAETQFKLLEVRRRTTE